MVWKAGCPIPGCTAIAHVSIRDSVVFLIHKASYISWLVASQQGSSLCWSMIVELCLVLVVQSFVKEERERERERHTDRQTDRQRYTYVHTRRRALPEPHINTYND